MPPGSSRGIERLYLSVPVDARQEGTTTPSTDTRDMASNQARTAFSPMPEVNDLESDSPLPDSDIASSLPPGRNLLEMHLGFRMPKYPAFKSGGQPGNV